MFASCRRCVRWAARGIVRTHWALYACAVCIRRRAGQEWPQQGVVTPPGLIKPSSAYSYVAKGVQTERTAGFLHFNAGLLVLKMVAPTEKVSPQAPACQKVF